MSKIKVGQDEGHGGKDSGARGYLSNEKTLVLKIGDKVANILNKNGFEVVRSRTGDRTVSLKNRTDKFNSNNVDIIYSLHMNSAKSNKAKGFESFIFSGKVSSKTKQLQNALHDAIMKTGLFNDRGKKRANFHMLRESKAPAVLLEIGFINNKEEEKKVMDNIDLIASNLAQGIVNFLGGDYKPIKNNKPGKPPKQINKLNYDKLANDVLLGKHGNGHKQRQKSLGLNDYDYQIVRERVNRKVGRPGKSKNNFNKMVHEVLIGKHGNGHETRRKSLGVSKSEYGKIRKEVNRLLK